MQLSQLIVLEGPVTLSPLSVSIHPKTEFVWMVKCPSLGPGLGIQEEQDLGQNEDTVFCLIHCI